MAEGVRGMHSSQKGCTDLFMFVYGHMDMRQLSHGELLLGCTLVTHAVGFRPTETWKEVDIAWRHCVMRYVLTCMMTVGIGDVTAHKHCFALCMS